MYKKTILYIVGLTLITSVYAVEKKQEQEQEQEYIIATGTKGGTYYPVGNGLAKILSDKLNYKNISFKATNSAGSGENIDRLVEKKVDFAFIQALFGSMAWNGVREYKYRTRDNLRAITALWPNVEQFAIKSKHVKTGTIIDMYNLYGQNISIGARNSGSMTSTLYIFDLLGIDQKKMNIKYLGHGASARAFQKDEIEAMNPSAGTPTNAIKQIFNSMNINDFKILEFKEKDLLTIKNQLTVYFPFIIKAGTYPNQVKDISTIAQSNVLITRDDVSIELVYALTKTIYENLSLLYNIHPATKVMVLEKAIEGLHLPLHEGAAMFYLEKGIKIPYWLWNDSFKLK